MLDNFGGRFAGEYTKSSLDRPWWDTAIGMLPLVGDAWRLGKSGYDAFTSGAVENAMPAITDAASAVSGQAFAPAMAEAAAREIAAPKVLETAKTINGQRDPYNASWDAPGALEQYQSRFSHELNALPKFKRGTNFWDANNPLHQGLRNDAIAGTGTANANALNQLSESLALRNVDRNDGIGAESERMFRLDNARQQGGQMSAIEQDRYKRYADFETDQDNLQRDYDTKIAMAKDAQSRGDFTLASSLLTDAQQRASSALDMQQKSANLAEFQATSPNRVSAANAGYKLQGTQDTYGINDAQRYEAIAGNEFQDYQQQRPMMRDLNNLSLKNRIGDARYASAWGDVGRFANQFGPMLAYGAGMVGSGGVTGMIGAASKGLSPGSYSRAGGGEQLPNPDGGWGGSGGPLTSLRRPMGTSGGGSFGGPRAFSSVAGHKPGMW